MSYERNSNIAEKKKVSKILEKLPPLCEAIRNGDVDAVNRLLDDFNFSDTDNPLLKDSYHTLLLMEAIKVQTFNPEIFKAIYKKCNPENKKDFRILTVTANITDATGGPESLIFTAIKKAPRLLPVIAALVDLDYCSVEEASKAHGSALDIRRQLAALPENSHMENIDEDGYGRILNRIKFKRREVIKQGIEAHTLIYSDINNIILNYLDLAKDSCSSDEAPPPLPPSLMNRASLYISPFTGVVALASGILWTVSEFGSGEIASKISEGVDKLSDPNILEIAFIGAVTLCIISAMVYGWTRPTNENAPSQNQEPQSSYGIGRG